MLGVENGLEKRPSSLTVHVTDMLAAAAAAAATASNRASASSSTAAALLAEAALFRPAHDPTSPIGPRP